ncbi:MAG: ester cyclase [Desulfomonilaceae bacterium]
MDYQHHDPNAPDPGGGAEGYIRRNSVFLTAFPDRQLTFDDQVAEGDRVATRITMRATQTGDLPGIPATGRPVTIESMHICRISDGQIAEEWELFDALGMMRQLAASTSPGLTES